jgi:nicotinamide riboside transporter PnuC
MAGSFLLFFAKKNFSSSIFLTLIFLIYYFHFFFIPLYYDSNDFIIYLFIIIIFILFILGFTPMITWSRNPHANDTTPRKPRNQVWKCDIRITLNLNTNTIGI